jgi:hypothetical protein
LNDFEDDNNTSDSEFEISDLDSHAVGSFEERWLRGQRFSSHIRLWMVFFTLLGATALGLMLLVPLLPRSSHVSEQASQVRGVSPIGPSLQQGLLPATSSFGSLTVLRSSDGTVMCSGPRGTIEQLTPGDETTQWFPKEQGTRGKPSLVVQIEVINIHGRLTRLLFLCPPDTSSHQSQWYAQH